MRNAAGEVVVSFTSGHVRFRQSLLVRVRGCGADNLLLRSDQATCGWECWRTRRGERRLLELTGLVDADGVFVAGTRIETVAGTLTANGSADYTIDFAAESPESGRSASPVTRPSEDMPQVVYLGDETGESELLEALREAEIDALARGEVGNLRGGQSFGRSVRSHRPGRGGRTRRLHPGCGRTPNCVPVSTTRSTT